MEGIVLELDIDRIHCIFNEFNRLVNLDVFQRVKLIITDNDIHIIPLCDGTKIVFNKDKRG